MEEENNRLIRKKVFENLIIAIAIMLYFIIGNLAYSRIDEDMLIKGLKVTSLVILFLSIVIFEIAYHKDSGKIALNGIEILVLSIHTLTILHVVNKIKTTVDVYLLFSTYFFAIYYIFKSIIIYTNEKRKYVKNLSDIHEIVNNTPSKKEAKKRNKEENI